MLEDALKGYYDYPSFMTNKNDPGYSNFLTTSIDQTVLDDNHIATCASDALFLLKNKKNLTMSQLLKCLNTRNISTAGVCTVKKVNCDPSQTKYYRLDGQCNNHNNPLWGSVNTPMIRLFPAGPDDFSGSTARSDSLKVTSKLGIITDRPPGFNSEMTTVALQILTHELMKTKKVQLFSEKRDGGFNCINPNNDPVLADLIKKNRYCIPISVKSGDPCYGARVKLLNYIKSLKSLDSCKLELYPASTSFQTSVFDCKLIYNELSLPHLDANGGQFDADNFEKMNEILVGYDERSMQIPGLFLFLNFFVKFHNIVFAELASVHTSLSPQALSFESRKIVCAVFQKIMVDLVLEILRQSEQSVLFNLGNCYDPSIRPGVSLEFDLTFRNCHRFIQDTSMIYDKSLFEQSSGLKSAHADPVDIRSMLNNLTFYTDNKCGLTHGSKSWLWVRESTYK